MDSNRSTAVPAFTPNNCAFCGYLLSGLPAAGRCPECGQEYGAADGIILFGWAQRTGALRLAPLSKWYWIAGVWAVWIGSGVVNALISGEELWLRLLLAALAFLAAVAPMAMVLHMRATAGTRAKPKSQVRLYAEGYGQRKGFGDVALMRWNQDMEIVVAREAEGIYRLQMDRFGPAGYEDWAGRIRLFFLSDAASAAAIQARVKQWQREAGDILL
jgi:hypothetical protein